MLTIKKMLPALAALTVSVSAVSYADTSETDPEVLCDAPVEFVPGQPNACSYFCALPNGIPIAPITVENVKVTNGGLLALINCTVEGDVTATDGGSIFLFNTKVGGNVSVEDAVPGGGYIAAEIVGGTVVNGSVKIENSEGWVQVRDSVVAGGVKIENIDMLNTLPHHDSSLPAGPYLTVANNTISGGVKIENVLVTEDVVYEFSGNIISGNAKCENVNADIDASNNIVAGHNTCN